MRGFVGKNPLAMAFAFSLAVHGALYGTWRVGRTLNWWDAQPAWLLKFYKMLQPSPSTTKLSKLLPQIIPPEVRKKEIPLTFMEVDPTLAVPEPPKETKFYGAANAVAAQPEPTIDVKTPKVDGKQENVPRLKDVPRPVLHPLQPSAPPEEPKPKPAQKPGDQAIATIGEPAPERPRTLAAARAAKGMLAGEKMRQDGGVNRRGQLSVNVKGTPFGAYDAAFIAAVQQRWYDLIDTSQVVPRSGKVQLQFRLIYDGRITDMKVNDENVGDLLTLLCQRAVLDPAPYARWPSDMRRMIGENYREVTFTFYYN